MRIRTIITFLFALAACVVIPVFMMDKTDKPIDILNAISAIIGSIASVATLLIAILLFKKYGIETPLLEKQATVVFNLAEELKKGVLLINDKDFMVVIFLYNPHENLLAKNHSLETRYGNKLIFSGNYMNYIRPLLTISESPFMPKSIADKVLKISSYVMVYDIPADKMDSYSKVGIPTEINSGTDYAKFNGEEITLFEYLNLVEDIKVEIKSWIKQNSDYLSDLNF